MDGKRLMAEPSAREPTDRVTFARDLGVFDASMIGIGAMIGTGVAETGDELIPMRREPC
jgi:hypothetical protein